MSTFPTQTIIVPQVLTAEEEVRRSRLAFKEARWWALWPGEEGYDIPLHEYLGFTDEQAWRDYAISARRTR